MYLRTAEMAEFEAIRQFYWDLIDGMTGQKHTIGWKKGIYPADDFLLESIQQGTLYVLDGENDQLAACVVFNNRWNEGYEGCPWSVDCGPDQILVPHALAVDPALQGQGIGKIVVEDLIEMAGAMHKKTIRLDILKGNFPAERLYTKMGFSYVQEKEMFYEDTGRTAYVMYEYLVTGDRA